MKEKAQPEDLYSALVAILFTSGVPTEIQELEQVLQIPPKQILQIVKNGNELGLSKYFLIQVHKEQLQLVTHPSLSKYVQQWQLKDEEEELSPHAKEALAIIAFKQPISRTQIEEIRGIDSRRVLKKLLLQGLIQLTKAPEQGDPRAYYYETSIKFLEYFGLASLEDLYEKINLNQ